MLQARKNEHKTEEHLKSIAERENGRLVQENQILMSELEKLKETRNAHEVNLKLIFQLVFKIILFFNLLKESYICCKSRI